MSSDNHMNNSEKEVDEVDAALSDLEITLEGGKTSNTLVRRLTASSGQLLDHRAGPSFLFSCREFISAHCSSLAARRAFCLPTGFSMTSPVIGGINQGRKHNMGIVTRGREITMGA